MKRSRRRERTDYDSGSNRQRFIESNLFRYRGHICAPGIIGEEQHIAKTLVGNGDPGIEDSD